MTSRFDDILDGVGFMRTDVLPLLASAGVLIDEKAMPSRPAEKRPDLRPFIPRVNVTLAEAADILAQANGGNWWATLEDAADSGQIQAGTWGIDRGEQPLSHADLRAWCEAGGFIWPIPLPPGATPTTDEGLRKALADVHNRAAGLQAEIDRLRDESKIRADEAARLADERDKLKADGLEGKTKSTLLKIIGGLAMSGHGMSIHDERLSGITEMVKDLQRVGVDVTEKTLRERLKEAASIIDRPNGKAPPIR